jgi:transcriptional regulator with XRE-family HTH domain
VGAKLTPKQEREEARKMLGITMRQIKAAIDADYTASLKGGNRNARKRQGISYETLERLANPDKVPEGKEAEELEKILDEILAKEATPENMNEYDEEEEDDEEEDDEEEEEDDDIGSSLAGSSFDAGSFAMANGGGGGGGLLSARKSGDSQRSASMRRVVIPSRLVHVEKVIMDAETTFVSWSFQVGSCLFVFCSVVIHLSLMCLSHDFSFYQISSKKMSLLIKYFFIINKINTINRWRQVMWVSSQLLCEKAVTRSSRLAPGRDVVIDWFTRATGKYHLSWVRVS